jgi:hypothetical protein
MLLIRRADLISRPRLSATTHRRDPQTGRIGCRAAREKVIHVENNRHVTVTDLDRIADVAGVDC